MKILDNSLVRTEKYLFYTACFNLLSCGFEINHIYYSKKIAVSKIIYTFVLLK
jgi:hypothetical protein